MLDEFQSNQAQSIHNLDESSSIQAQSWLNPIQSQLKYGLDQIPDQVREIQPLDQSTNSASAFHIQF